MRTLASMAASARPTMNGVAVNFVYTPPEFRKNGYASSCVWALSKKLLRSDHSFCTLFTDLSNPTSNAIYKNIGYQQIDEFVMYKFL
ncbi:hypothetical protein KAR04_09575 [Candidatus Calescamantes bacterium]|nr:hypothetical protein [Candidatus Calescamantes bacterium]